MNKLIVDIETLPNQKLKGDLLPKFDESSVKVGNLKDPAKIQEKVDAAKAEFETGLTKKMSVESNYCQILSLGYIELDDTNNVIKQDVIYSHDDDKAIILHFNGFVYNGQTIIGWNSKHFDIPIIWKRSILNLEKPAFNYRKLCNPYNDESIDLMHIWNSGGYGKMADCASLLGISAKDGMDGSMIYDAWKAGETDRIKEYNMQDCETTLSIYRKIYA